MIGDHLGNLKVLPEDIIKRDQKVFEFSRKHDKPIIMLLSGGYQKENAENIADSIKNLHEKFHVLG